MDAGKQIRRLRRAAGMTQEELGERLGVTSVSVCQWERNRAQPRMYMLQNMAEIFGVPLSVVMGEEPVPHYAVAPHITDSAYLPLRGRVHAGDPCDPEELDGRLIMLPREIADAHKAGFFVEVEGDCMDRVYPEGCYVLVDPAISPQNGQIAAVSLSDGRFVMRRIYRGRNALILSPESYNDAHEDIVVVDGETVTLVGTAVWFQGEL